MSKLLYGCCINDSDYAVTSNIDGKWVSCPFFSRWRSMIQRSYCPKFKIAHPCTDESITVEEWKRFSVFKAWMQTQPWEYNQLDKDMLIRGNNVYGPDSARFIPHYLNGLLNKPKTDSNLPLGVTKGFRKSKPSYLSYSSVDGKRKHLGVFDTPLEAHAAWQLAKADNIQNTIARYAAEDCFNTEIADRLLLVAWELMLSAAEGKETLNFQ